MNTVQPNLQIDNKVLQAGKQTFRAVIHPLRQKMIQLIHANGRMTVTEIHTKLKLEQSVASAHLAILRRGQFLKAEKDRRFIYYSVNYERIREVHEISRELTGGT
jgi:DNA-binding transcriptional ArsR family regulator